MKSLSELFQPLTNREIKTTISSEYANRLASLTEVCEGTEADVLKNSLRLLELLAKSTHERQPVMAVQVSGAPFELLDDMVIRDAKAVRGAEGQAAVTRIALTLGNAQIKRLDKIKEILDFSEYREVFAAALRVYEISIEHHKNGGSFAHYKPDGTSTPIDIFDN